MSAKEPDPEVNAVQSLPVDAYCEASRVETVTKAQGWWVLAGSGRTGNIARRMFTIREYRFGLRGDFQPIGLWQSLHDMEAGGRESWRNWGGRMVQQVTPRLN
jgi:hypothetical protein